MKIKTKGNYWTVDEITAEVLERTGKRPVLVVGDGVLELTFQEELPQNEIDDLTIYFGGVHDLPDVSEKAEKAARLAELKTKAAKVKDEKLTLPELREVVAVLAEMMGAIDGD